MARGVAKPEKRNRGNEAGGDWQDRERQVRAAEHKRARSLKINEKNGRKRNKQDRFDKQTGNGGGAGLFSEQSVKSKGDAEHNGDPREAAITESQIQHAKCGEQNRHELQFGEAFAQKKCAKENIHQRGHEIAQGGFYDAAGV